jgi:glycosyltransferase involved in cell wall biosynthesis
VEDILKREKIDILYMRKAGENDGKCPKSVKTCIHAVFNKCDPHGSVYAYISEWLSEQQGGRYPFVPHILDLPLASGDLRAEFDIPKQAIVFGRLGGPDQFDIEFVHHAIIEALDRRHDIWFLLGNTDRFYDHPRLIHYPPFCDEQLKRRFINSCDAMIHARRMGESFGLAIAEFSAANKPVITFKGGRDKAHLKMLGDRALYYTDHDSLLPLLLGFDRSVAQGDWDVYSQKFTPEKVMAKFKQVFIEG